MKKIALYLIAAAVALTTACNEEFKSSGVTAVTLNVPAMTLIKGKKATLTATVEPSTAPQEVGWSSSDPAVATVSESGEVTAVSAGVAYISATSKVGKRAAACTVYVDPIPVTGVTVAPTLALLVHDDAKLVETVLPADAGNKNVKWSSDEPEIVSVNALGELHAYLPGEAKITVTTLEGGFEAVCTVTVTKIPVTKIVLSQTNFEGVDGDKLTLKATVEPENASFPQITWSTNNDKMATVKDGVVTIVNKEPGSAVIRVTSNDNKDVWAECNVKVNRDNSGLVEKVVWEGTHAMDDSWGNWLDIQSSWWAEAVPGSLIIFYVENVDFSGGYAQAQIQTPGWKGFLTASAKSANGATQVLETVLTQDMIDNLRSGTCHLGGYNLTVKKITLLYKVVSVDVVLWEGNVAFGSWGPSVNLDKALCNEKNLKVGQTLVFTLGDYDDGASNYQFILKTWGWADIAGTKKDLKKGDLTCEFVITQAVLDLMKNEGIRIQGNGLSMKKIVIKGDAPEGEVIWTGNHDFVNWGPQIDLPPAKWANAKVGNTLLFEVGDQYNTSWQFVLKTWGWADIPGFTANLTETSKTHEFTINQTLLDYMKGEGIRIQGKNVFMKKITLKQ